MTPSCGIITCPPNTRKSHRTYIMGIKYDFYPDFICQKPKLKWNLTKFDFLRTQKNNLNWCIPTVRNTPTSGPRSSGTLQFETPNQLSSTPRFLPSPYLHPILWEETLNTRNNLISYWNRLMTSLLAPNTGILWKVSKQNPDQAAHFLPSSSPCHLCQHLQFAGVELIFVGVTIALTHLPHPLTLSCGNLLRSCNPEEEYITCVTAALQNLASWSRTLSQSNRQEGPPLRRSRRVVPQRTNQTVSETDLTQRDLPPIPFIHRLVNPARITEPTRTESPVPF